MKETAAIDKPVKYGCEFCKREFARESTVLKHICEYKHRWIERDKQGNRLGFQSWLQFYKKNSASKKQKTYEEFIKSAYYIAFVKFGSYCVNVNALNVSRFVDWLLKNQIKIDSWCQDSIYTKYLIEYLRTEDAFDAIARSIETCIEKSTEEGIQTCDYLRYGNSNKICYAITTGKISPWMLYCSDSGVRFLETLNQPQVKMISDYINPEQWALKFHRDTNLKQQIRETLKLAGY
jgi:hypothetical protein